MRYRYKSGGPQLSTCVVKCDFAQLRYFFDNVIISCDGFEKLARRHFLETGHKLHIIFNFGLRRYIYEL